MYETQSFHLDQSMLDILHAADDSDSTLLITGSTGTGKSHLAATVHKASRRGSSGRWHKVNLATLSENLIESELFGHERGAFTGADSRRVGRLEACNGGTVFLDEIGELPLRLQAKLLDFIQYKRISPVGSNREIELDVRIIAATNRDLAACVKAGEFRADLFHRLNVFHVKLEDLAAQPQAVLKFAAAIVSTRAEVMKKKVSGLSPETERIFGQYAWPGNIRELENVLEFAVAMERTDRIRLASLPPYLRALASGMKCGESAKETQTAAPAEAPRRAPAEDILELPMSLSFHESKDAFEKMFLERALLMCQGQINLTSRRTGLNKVSLADKIRRYGIDWRKIRYDSLGPALREAR